MAKSRKGKVRKITASDRRAQLTIKRRNPAFRKHENKSKEEVTLVIDYITLLAQGEDPRPLLATNDELVERMDGLQGVHEFLYMLEGLKDDWEDRLEDDGILKLSALSTQGVEFALQNEEDKAKYI